MAARTNLAKVISDPNAGKHYLFKDGQFMNEWAGKTVSDVVIYQNGSTSAYTATIQNNHITIPQISFSAVGDFVVTFPEIPAATMADKDHLLIHFSDKNFVDQSDHSLNCAVGHTSDSTFKGGNLAGSGDKMFIAIGGYCAFLGKASVGTHYTYTCAKEVFSDNVEEKHFISVSTEESDETEAHIPFLVGACGDYPKNFSTFSISEIYMENID